MFSTSEVEALTVRTLANSLCTTSKVFIIFSSISSKAACKVMAKSLETQERIINHEFTRMNVHHTLLIDADDTLWENNIYFDRTIAEFVAALVQRGINADRAQQVLWQTEQRNIKTTGYGSHALCQSLHEVAKQLGAPDLEP